MKKTYTKKQIREVISYWKNVLRKMNEFKVLDDIDELDIISRLRNRRDISDYLKAYI